MEEVLSLAFACPACGGAVEERLAAESLVIVCPHCATEIDLLDGEATRTGRPLAHCPICSSRDLYQQRDFNRKLGLGIALVGLLLGPFTHWISMFVAVALDAALYLLVPVVCICYACNAQLRGVSPPRRPLPFDIAVHDAYKFDRRHPPRPERAVAGPLASRLRRKEPR